MKSPVFPEPQDLGKRDWGREELLVLVPGRFSLKRLEIHAGKRGGLQFHHEKDEAAVLISGQLIIRVDHGDGHLREHTLLPGSVVHFPPGLVHQEEALTDCVLIEASTPHFNDRVRVERRYGLEAEGGLPSTTPDQVIEK